MKVIGSHKVDILKDDSLLKAAGRKSYDLILLEGEVEMLPSLKAADPYLEVIIFTHREEDVSELIKQGAYAYFSFPFDPERLKNTIDSIDDMVEMRRATSRLESQLTTNYTFFDGVVGKNPQMLDTFIFIKRIAPYYRTAIIMGETGTGKEVIAKALHSQSPVSTNPIIICDCGALVETLIGSELFGHKKGSFTGAVADKNGVFEAAGEGTIFLDEISELPLPSQTNLLRVLQTGEFKRVGDHRVLRAKCRFIAATNKNLQEEVKKGNFREDLFYRITQFMIEMPPLRERKDDIPLLCRYFLERFSNGTGKKVLGISRPAQIIMMSYDWPGNVRELENTLERAAILTTESFIRPVDLPEYLKKISTEKSLNPLFLGDVIKKHIEETLISANGNKTEAAKMLGITKRSLLRKIEKYLIKAVSRHTHTKNAPPKH
ncbi:MAG: sigma-54 dependent transcriptional regulator [Thermodesulfovibrionales bacterium]